MRRSFIMLCFAAIPLLTLARAEDDGDLAKELPRIAGKDPEAAMGTFAIRPGFALRAAAVEPIVTDPVAASYDEDGRLYVVEMRGYPYPENLPTGGVVRLEDSDGDGRFDKRSVFLDGLSWPTGVVAARGGVFIAVAPRILFARDVDGDGKADEVRTLFEGFGTQNVQGLLNGLLVGLDGWIHGSSGSNGGEIRNLSKPGSPAVSVRGRDFRFKPDGSEFEATSGGGQFGHSFDDWGRRFVCNNSNHARQIIIPARYLERNPALATSGVLDDIAVEGGAGPVYRISSAEPWRVVRTRQRKADPVISKRLAPTELYAIGFFTSATGITVYRGSAYPEAYRGNLFIGDVGGNLVHRKLLERNGPIFAARRADEKVEFLASTDNWFRPVNIANTPNGTLLILDMYRETIEHPASIPEPIKKHLDLTSGKDRGRLYELVVAGESPRVRSPKLSKASTEDLVAHLAEPDSWWRDAAQRLLIERGDRAAVPLLEELARRRPTALARLHALWTLADLGSLDPALLVAACDDPSADLRENVARLAEPLLARSPVLLAVLERLASDADAMVRMQAAFSLGAIDREEALDALAAIAERDGANRWSRTAVLSSIGGRASRFLAALAKRNREALAAHGGVWLEELGTLIGAEGDAERITEFVREYAVASKSVGASKALLGLSRGLARSGRSLAGIDAPGLKDAYRSAAETLSGDGPISARIDAARLLGLAPSDRAIEPLTAQLDARRPVPLQLAALQALGEQTTNEVAPRLISKWDALSPALRREALEVLLARAERARALLDAIEAGKFRASTLEPSHRARLLASPVAEIRERAKKLAEAPASDRAGVIAAFRPALDRRGDAAKGKTLFKAICASCHKAEGEGHDVGPNLATIVGRSPEDLLIHILDPNREVPPNLASYNVALDDGRVISGLIVDESANSITLRRAEGATDVVPRARIEAVASSGLSLMPEGLEKNQTPESFADLIAYLRSIGAGGR
ncbi:MAG: HEAT repeat domain-containing protein [Isosphaeraceae bacterium]|nr:HEAT repeat domain-containing protein [Isosphaeraceae bacterium]